MQFNSKWDHSKKSINGNYSIGSLDLQRDIFKTIQNNLPGNYNILNQSTTHNDYDFNQSIDAVFKADLDSTMNMEVSVKGTISTNKNNDNTLFATRHGNGYELNRNNIRSENEAETKNVNTYAMFSKKLSSRGNTISVFTSIAVNRSKLDSYLQNTLQYFNSSGGTDSIQATDQYKPGRLNDQKVSAGFTYSEPLSPHASIIVAYSINSKHKDNYNGTFDKSVFNRYDVPDLEFSNHFKLRDMSHKYTLGFFLFHTKLTTNISISMIKQNLKQTDLFIDTTLIRPFTNWNSNASLTYQITKASSLTFTYLGNTVQPTIEQLQPLRQNADLLNIALGNPSLKPSFQNDISVNYRLYKTSTDQGINLRGSFSNQINSIINNRNTDSSGVNFYQWSNLEDHQPITWSAYAEYYFHLPIIKAVFTFSFNISKNSYYGYVNGQLNSSSNVVVNPGISIAKNKSTYSYYVDFGMNLWRNNTSLQPVENNSRQYFAHLNFYSRLPFKFFAGSESSFDFYSKNQFFDRDLYRTLVKAYIGRYFLKEENLKVSFSANDLLNQNTGYSRSGGTDGFSEVRNNTIRRYFMLSVTWDFNKFGKSLQP